MSKIKKKLYIKIFVAVGLFCIFSVFFIIPSFAKEKVLITTPNPLLHKEGVKTISPNPKTKNPPLLDQGGVRGGNSVIVLAGDTTTNISFAPNTLFYDALVEAKNTRIISFNGKNYPGLGFFVTDIGTLHAGNGKSLLYYVNGKEATVGISSYALKDGDIIEWKLK